MPISTLKLTPYLIDWGESIYAKIVAINVVGSSLESDEGNGATILTTPDPPTDVSNVALYTDGSSIGVTWNAAGNGGSAIIDYSVTVNDSAETIEIINSGIAATNYVVTGLTAGTVYKVRV